MTVSNQQMAMERLMSYVIHASKYNIRLTQNCRTAFQFNPALTMNSLSS